MTTKNTNPRDAAELRRRAEEIAGKKAAQSPEHHGVLRPEESQQMLHELEVHQIELEIQNEELRRTQVELELLGASYFDLYDLAPVGYFTVSEKGLILQANLTAATLLGVTRGDFVHRPLSSFILAEDQDIFYLYRKQLFDTGTPQVCELRMRRDNAAPCWVRLDATVAKDANGAPVCRVAMSDITERKQAQAVLEHAHDLLEQRVKERTTELAAANKQLQADIEERKLAEETLRASEEKFRVAFEDAGAGMLMVVGDCRIARANAAFAHMAGYSQEELVGMSVLDVTFPEDRERTHSMLGSILAGAISHFTIENRYVGKEEQVFWGQTTASAVHGPDGKVIFVLGIIEDITARKKAEEALIKEQRTLTHLLQASDQERQAIAYEIHDELSQRLTGAIMQFQTFEALRDAKPKLATKAYQEGMSLLRQGHSETRRLIAGVRPPILDESGIVAAIDHLVSEQRDPLGPTFEYRNQVHFDRLAPTLENAIYRIVQEAVSNACQHSKSPKVRVSLVQRDDRVRIEIQDWGVGFDVKETPENKFGLEGIRQRVRLLGGMCSIRSMSGKGTTVAVELPLLLVSDLVPCMATTEIGTP